MRHWANLQKREQLVVLWGGGVLLLFFSYVLLIAPLRSDLGHLKESVAIKSTQLQWMEDGAIEVAQLKGLRANRAGVSPLKIIDQSARKFGVDGSLKRVDPGEDDKIKVWFEDLVYLDFIRFLRGTAGNNELAITSLAVERLDAPGIVNARVTFKAVK